MLNYLLAAGPLEIKPQTVDRYGRTVAEVYVNGRHVSLAMVQQGAALEYHQ